MTINPSDYDTRELRGEPEDRSARRNQDIEELRRDLAAAGGEEGEFPREALKELILLESGADPDDLERPYLETVPEQYAGRLTVFEWLQFTLDRRGFRKTLDALEYYENIGWLSETAADDLREHVRVFQDPSKDGSLRPFETTDHLISLVYIARLATMA